MLLDVQGADDAAELGQEPGAELEAPTIIEDELWPHPVLTIAPQTLLFVLYVPTVLLR